MSVFEEAVSIFMSSPVHVIQESTDVREAEENMAKLGVTCLVAVNASGEVVGVVTDTDLLENGLRNAGDSVLSDQSIPVSSIMTPGVISVEIKTSLLSAATQMLRARVHRVFVMAGGNVAGVISTTDIMSAVEQERIETPISQLMSIPVFTVKASQDIGTATERLKRAHISGLIVVDESEWPVGLYGKREALRKGDALRSAPVESVMNSALLTVPDHTAIHDVAKQAMAMKARQVAVMNRHELVGVMTGTDFAKAIS